MGLPLYASCASSPVRQRVSVVIVTLHCEQLAATLAYTRTMQARHRVCALRHFCARSGSGGKPQSLQRHTMVRFLWFLKQMAAHQQILGMPGPTSRQEWGNDRTRVLSTPQAHSKRACVIYHQRHTSRNLALQSPGPSRVLAILPATRNKTVTWPHYLHVTCWFLLRPTLQRNHGLARAVGLPQTASSRRAALLVLTPYLHHHRVSARPGPHKCSASQGMARGASPADVHASLWIEKRRRA